MTEPLYSKYRPIKFSEVLGQDAVVASLKKVLKEGRARQFLFTGPSGVGKTTLARIVASDFVGGRTLATNLIEEAAANNTGIDDVRRIIERSLRRAIGPVPEKAIILDEVHRLSPQAWDALLKPIEEPPKHVCWLLCTTNLGKVPKTIQTRCLKYDLKPVNEGALLDLLDRVSVAEGIRVPDEVLEAIGESSDGSPRQALVHLEVCLQCKTAAEAQAAMRTAQGTKEAIDLCRFLMGGNRNWADAMKLVSSLNNVEAESVRITVVNYLAAALLKTQGDKAKHLLYLLECFREPYLQSDRMAPLLYSLGLALGLQEE